jgi:hypothetical protein
MPHAPARVFKYDFGAPAPIVALQFKLAFNRRGRRPQVIRERPPHPKVLPWRIECNVCGEQFKPWGDGTMHVSKRCWVRIDDYIFDLESKTGLGQLRLFRVGLPPGRAWNEPSILARVLR